MISKFLEYVLVGTSISPIFITFFINELIRTGSIIKGIHWLLLFLISLVVFCIIKNFAVKHFERLPIEITHVSPADKEIATFLVGYVLPFLNIGSSNFSMQMTIVLVLYIIVLSSSSYHFNPILTLFGYHYYEIIIESTINGRKHSYAYILMTKKTIKNCKDIKEVIQISDYMLMEVNK